ncbi:transcriptional regulator [Shewanella sp. OPT22]|nr:transcriptional regulator [Shewanella sp. OPT22]
MTNRNPRLKHRIIKLVEIAQLMKCSRTTLHKIRMMDETFPSEIIRGGVRIGWNADEILQWIFKRKS